jgi:hypothetical protein
MLAHTVTMIGREVSFGFKEQAALAAWALLAGVALRPIGLNFEN